MKKLIENLFKRKTKTIATNSWNDDFSGSWSSFVENPNLYKRKLLLERCREELCEFGDFGNIMFPIVRRVFAQTLANDLVSVQPLALPTGMLGFLDYNYEPKNLYKRELMLEKYNRKNNIFKSPGVYTVDRDITIYPPFDMVTEPGFSGANIEVPPLNVPELMFGNVENKKGLK